MTQKKIETTIDYRQLSEAEKSVMRKAHWILIPAICIPIFIMWVLSNVDIIPNAAKYGANTIALGVIIVMIVKQFKLDNDIRNGEAEVINGILEDKFKFGKSMNTRSGRTSRKKSSGTPNFILVFSGKKYWVQSKIYTQAEKGAHSEMIWLPSSKYVVSIRKV